MSFVLRDVLDYIAHKGSTRGASSQVGSYKYSLNVELDFVAVGQ